MTVAIHLDCVPCLAGHAVRSARDLGLEEDAATELVRGTLERLLEFDWSLPPPLMGRHIHRAIRERIGTADPYLAAKRADTRAALALLPEMEARVAAARRPFLEAVRVALAGNIIDAAAGPGWDRGDAVLGALPEVDDEAAVERLEHRCRTAGSVLYLADNAGEIVFDRPLLDRIGADKITVVVRGAPALNDATLDDARRGGLEGRYTLVANGSDIPGTWLADCSADLVARVERADLIIAKGMGNYETLSGVDRPAWFLFIVKCPVLARETGRPLGRAVVLET